MIRLKGQPCEHHISKTNKREFYPILVTYVFRFVDILIRFHGQKLVKVTVGNDPKTE